MGKWNAIFNIIIEDNNLIDINLSNSKYTWCNDHVGPTYAKLDRFFGFCKLNGSVSTMMALTREMSAHAPLRGVKKIFLPI
jgi:hypothetical protein